MAVPVRKFGVHGEIDAGVRLGGPALVDLGFLDQVRRAARPVDDVYTAEIIPVLQAVVDQGAQGGQTNAAADEKQILSF